MPDTPLHYQTIAEVGARLQSKQVSPVELTSAILGRIEALDGDLKSYATLMADSALASARTAEAEIAAGRYRGGLHGVPIAVKDLCFTTGVATMGGARVLRDFVPDFDGTVVRKLNAAGAVILGKLNLTEGAMAGYNPEFQIPVNPWGADRWSGASSSGSGVATAAGLCYGSLGSDTGGSIRFPAAACGIVGIKPTWGRVSRYGVLALAESLDHVGPMTRSASDAGVMLQAIAGHDPNDPTSLTAPVPNMLAGVAQGVRGVRIGVDERYIGDGVDSELAAAVLDGARLLESRGAVLVPVRMPDTDPLSRAWGVLCSAEAAARPPRDLPFPGRRIRPLVPGLAGAGVAPKRHRLRHSQLPTVGLQRDPGRIIRRHRRVGLSLHDHAPGAGHAGSALRPDGRRGMELGTVHHPFRLQRSAHHIPPLRTEQRGPAPQHPVHRQALDGAAAGPGGPRLRGRHPAPAAARRVAGFLSLPLTRLRRRMDASSNGPGAATAAGLCYGSLTSDTGGSIRIPSAACGIVGINPTCGALAGMVCCPWLSPWTRWFNDPEIQAFLVGIYLSRPNIKWTLCWTISPFAFGIR